MENPSADTEKTYSGVRNFFNNMSDETAKKMDPYVRLLAGSCVASLNLMGRYHTLRSRVCETLISTSPEEEKIGKISTLLLERHAILEDATNNLKDEYNQQIVELLKFDPVGLLELADHNTLETKKYESLIYKMGEIIKSDETPKNQVSKLVKLLI